MNYLITDSLKARDASASKNAKNLLEMVKNGQNGLKLSKNGQKGF